MGIVRERCFQGNRMGGDGAQTGGEWSPVLGWMEGEKLRRRGMMLLEMADRHGFSARSTSRAGLHRTRPSLLYTSVARPHPACPDGESAWLAAAAYLPGRRIFFTHVTSTWGPLCKRSRRLAIQAHLPVRQAR